MHIFILTMHKYETENSVLLRNSYLNIIKLHLYDRHISIFDGLTITYATKNS